MAVGKTADGMLFPAYPIFVDLESEQILYLHTPYHSR